MRRVKKSKKKTALKRAKGLREKAKRPWVLTQECAEALAAEIRVFLAGINTKGHKKTIGRLIEALDRLETWILFTQRACVA